MEENLQKKRIDHQASSKQTILERKASFIEAVFEAMTMQSANGWSLVPTRSWSPEWKRDDWIVRHAESIVPYECMFPEESFSLMKDNTDREVVKARIESNGTRIRVFRYEDSRESIWTVPVSFLEVDRAIQRAVSMFCETLDSPIKCE